MSTIANQGTAAVASEARTHTRFIPGQESVQALATSITISKLESPVIISRTRALPAANFKQELDIVPTFDCHLSSALRSPTQGSASETGDSISLSDFPHPPQDHLARIRPEFLQERQNQQPVASISTLAMRSLQPPSIPDIDIKKKRRKITTCNMPSESRIEPLGLASRMEAISLHLRRRRGRGASESSESDDMTHAIPGSQADILYQVKTPRVSQKDTGMIHGAEIAPTSKPRTESNNVVDAPRTTERSNAVMEEPRIMRAPTLMNESYAMGSASGSTSIIRASRIMEGRKSTIVHAPRMVERSYAMMHGEKFVPISSSAPQVAADTPRANEIDHDEMDEQDHARATHFMEWLRITTSGQIQNLHPIKSATSEDVDIIRAPRMTSGSYAHSKPISASTVEQASTISDDSIGSTLLCPPPPPTLRTMDEPTTKLLAKKLRKVGETAQARKMLREQAKQTAASGAQSPKRRSFTELVSSASRSDLESKVVGIFHMRRRSKSGDSSSSSTTSLRVATPEASRGSFARLSTEFFQ